MTYINKYSELFNDSMKPREILRILCTAIDGVPENEREMFSKACLHAETEAQERINKQLRVHELAKQGKFVCVDY